VGEHLCRHLAGAGARLVVADTCQTRMRAAMAAHGATPADPARVHALPVDVLAPCGGDLDLDDRLIPQIGARIIAGAACPQVRHPREARLLMQRGILHVPEDVAAAGGLREARRLGITPFEMADRSAASLLRPRKAGRAGPNSAG
jgi:leucine dehydrogenase